MDCPFVFPAHSQHMSRLTQTFSAQALSVSGLIILAFALGCGTTTHDPKATFGSSFNPPGLTTLEPNTVPVNSPPFTLIVNGKNFDLDAVVFWNRMPQSTRFVSTTQLQVAITTDDLTQFGLAHIYVQTAGLTSNTVDFDVAAQ